MRCVLVLFSPSFCCLTQALPWLQWSALQSEEEERKKRVQRVAMKKAAAEGKGFGPPPKPGTSGFVPKVSIELMLLKELR